MLDIDITAILGMTWKMLLAVGLGGLVGYEREIHGRPAGLRTHILVCFGSALFTILSVQIAGIRFDPARIAAQIVSGIGFLGAGTIIRQGSIVRGLTTAASLWSVAAIGMAVGMGGSTAYLGAIASVIVFITLSVINQMEHKLFSHSMLRELVVTLYESKRELSQVFAVLEENGVMIQGMGEEFREQDNVVFRLRLRLPPQTNVNKLNEKLSVLPALKEFHWT